MDKKNVKKQVNVREYGVKLGALAKNCFTIPLTYEKEPPTNKKFLIHRVNFDGGYAGIFLREVLTLTFGDGFKASVTKDYKARKLRSDGITGDQTKKAVERIKSAYEADSGTMFDILDRLEKRAPRAKMLLEQALFVK